MSCGLEKSWAPIPVQVLPCHAKEALRCVSEKRPPASSAIRLFNSSTVLFLCSSCPCCRSSMPSTRAKALKIYTCNVAVLSVGVFLEIDAFLRDFLFQGNYPGPLTVKGLWKCMVSSSSVAAEGDLDIVSMEHGIFALQVGVLLDELPSQGICHCPTIKMPSIALREVPPSSPLYDPLRCRLWTVRHVRQGYIKTDPSHRALRRTIPALPASASSTSVYISL